MLTIAWDVDDVLNNLMHDWLINEWLPKHPKCSISYNEITKNPPLEILAITEKEYIKSLDSFRLSIQGQNLNPVPEVLEWFNNFGHKYHHIALTATPLDTAPLSAKWVIKHFGKWIRSFNFVPSHRIQHMTFNYHKNKIDYLSWWGHADILVEDNPETVLAAQSIGIRTLLIPRPWNESTHTIKDALKSLSNSFQPST